MRFLNYEQLKHIGVVYTIELESVKLMIQEHYDIPEYDNTVFLINAFDLVYDTEYDWSFLKVYKNKIYYMLEHKVKENEYSLEQYNIDTNIICNLQDFIGLTEFWTMDYEPQLCNVVRDNMDIPIKYMPVRYTTLIPQVKETYMMNKSIDYCHVGSISGSKHRLNIVEDIENFCYYISTKFITATPNLNATIPELNTSKYILDTLRAKNMLTPNQVRIFELLCMGYTVCTEKCSLNMFPGLVYEWETVEDLWNIVNKNEYLHPTEAYKEMTYTDEAYENYVNNLIQLQNGI